MSDPIQERTDCVKYPAWQPECRAVMLETDPAKVRSKFALAEAALATRAKELTRPADELERDERDALVEERQAMEFALAEILQQHPDLKK